METIFIFKKNAYYGKNIMRIIISESQYDQLSESKMRAWE